MQDAGLAVSDKGDGGEGSDGLLLTLYGWLGKMHFQNIQNIRFRNIFSYPESGRMFVATGLDFNTDMNQYARLVGCAAWRVSGRETRRLCE